MNKGFTRLFSERTMLMKASEIRELLKVTQLPDIISFAGGLPGPEAFPKEQISEICTDVLQKDGANALQYGTTEGVTKLRELVAARMKKKGIACELKNVIITEGSQQGLDLVSKVFIDPKNVVIVEAPSYLGGISAFNTFQAKIESIPLDDNGMQVDLLAEKMRNIHRHGGNPKFIYALPTFHNPAGVTMSELRRKQLLDLAANYDILILEDDPYSDLRYEGTDIKPIKAFDKEGRVIYLGTFSKILSPGMRLGWTIASDEILQKIIFAKQALDLCTSPFTQYIAAEFLERGYLEEHIEKIKKLYGVKKNIMLKAIEKYFPKEGVKWTKPQGGLFTWVTLPESIDARELFGEAIKERVAFVTGTAFYADGSGKNNMRLNFSHPSPDKLEEGIKRLAKVITAELEKHEARKLQPPSVPPILSP